MQEFAKLISLTVVKQALGMPDSDTTKDAILDRWIGWVSNAIQREAGQPIALQAMVLDLAPDNYRWSWIPPYILPYFPVSETLIAVESRDTTFGASWEDETLSDFGIERLGHLYQLTARNGFSYPRRYRVTVNVGYSEVPGEIQRVAMEMVVELVKQSDIAAIGKNRFGLQSVAESDSKTGITKTTTLLSKRDDWKEVIAHYSVAVTV